MKVAILGTVPVSKLLAPFNDPEWEIWVCSPGNRGGVIPRVTKWFEIHGVVDMKGPENNDWNKDYFAWLNAQQFPVLMQEPNDLCPQATIFPMRAWLKEFGNFGRMAATSSISWMIGYAVMMGATEIGIFGVDMAATEEAYSLQKAGCLIMMEMARQRGVHVTVPLESCLATMPPLYGYAEASRMGRKLLVREQTIIAELNNAQAQMNHFERLLNQLKGALDTTQYMRRTFVDGEHDAELDVAETGHVVGDQKVSVVHSKDATVQFEDHRFAETVLPVTRIEDIDPSRMPVEQHGGLLVPRGAKVNSGEAHAQE